MGIVVVVTVFDGAVVVGSVAVVVGIYVVPVSPVVPVTIFFGSTSIGSSAVRV